MEGFAQLSSSASQQEKVQSMSQQLQALRNAFMADGQIDAEEEALLKRIEEKLAEAERLLRQSTEGGNGAEQPLHTTEATIAGSGDETGDQPSPSPAVASISSSVGKGGKNAPDDVMAVQTLLNQNGASLETDGQVGPKTIAAITKFQQEAVGFADGRVDPGGQTWEALTGGKAAPPPEGFDDDLKSLIDDLPEPKTPPPVIDNEVPADDDADEPEGPWVDAETTVEFPVKGFTGAVKVATDSRGNVTSVGFELAAKADSPTFAVPPYYFGCGIATTGEVAFSGPGPLVDITIKIGSKGVGFLGVGPAVGGLVAGFKVEVELNGACNSPFGAVIDLETPANSTATFGLPIQFSAGGAIKAGVEIRAGDFGISEMVPIREYKDFIILRLDEGPECFAEFGPGFDQFITDIKNLHELVIESVKKAAENPKMVGTGDTGPILVGKAESIEDDINRVANEAQIAALRMAEDQMRAAYQAGWANPNLVGKANALTQQDADRAREIYGQAWTQRALAKQSYDEYSSPLDSAPIDIIDARRNQAVSIASKFNAAIALFQQGDDQW